MTKLLRRLPIQGTTDPDVPGCILVPIKKNLCGFPKVNYSVPETSYWRVREGKYKPVAIVTMTPGGINLGWDECGNCAHGILHCTCQLGISLPRSIEYIWITSGGKKPLPLPNAVRFQSPVPQPAARQLQPIKPQRKLKFTGEPKKRPLRRLILDDIETKEAGPVVGKPLRKLKR